MIVYNYTIFVLFIIVWSITAPGRSFTTPSDCGTTTPSACTMTTAYIPPPPPLPVLQPRPLPTAPPRPGLLVVPP